MILTLILSTKNTDVAATLFPKPRKLEHTTPWDISQNFEISKSIILKTASDIPLKNANFGAKLFIKTQKISQYYLLGIFPNVHNFKIDFFENYR